MSMTPAQAESLGALIVKARARKGLTMRALAAQIGVAVGWIAKLEAGQFVDPASDRLAKLSSLLDIPPSRINRITGGAMTNGLPEPRVYFRAKLGLTAEETDEVERHIRRLRGKS